MKILVLSAYHADSHRSWLDGLTAHLPDIEWTVLTLPPRYFSWRIRGNSLSWAMLERETLLGPYDVVLATSMTDLSALRGLVPELGRIPTVVYFHENQFSYPQSAQQRAGVEPQILNLYTALAADKALFNSEYNRSTMLNGVDSLLSRLPDFAPRIEVMAKLSLAQVLPVGLNFVDASSVSAEAMIAGEKFVGQPFKEEDFDGGCADGLSSRQRLSVLWNHRWEYDKGPDRLLALVKNCAKFELPVDLYIAGQQFRERPTEFAEIESIILSTKSLVLCQFGYVPDAQSYRTMLSSCDVVLSTAIHDFQGLSVLQAVAAGCVPLVPNRLCYPEWFAAEYCYESSDDIAIEAAAARIEIQRLIQKKRAGAFSYADVSALSWQRLAAQYMAVFEGLVKL
jgi:glycosyltransferase involved in cell wall biosynthesis